PEDLPRFVVHAEHEDSPSRVGKRRQLVCDVVALRVAHPGAGEQDALELERSVLAEADAGRETFRVTHGALPGSRIRRYLASKACRPPSRTLQTSSRMARACRLP